MWLPLFGRPPDARVTSLNVDLSTVVAAADQLLCLGVEDELLHVEFQSTYEEGFARRALLYNTLIGHRTGRCVESQVLLLRRKADGPAMSGAHRQQLQNGSVNLEFRFRVTRLWKIPLKEILEGGLGLLPLAPVVDEARPRVKDVLGVIGRRLAREAEPEVARSLTTATVLMLGLTFPKATIPQLSRHLMGNALKDSSTWDYFRDEFGEEFEKRGRQLEREEQVREALAAARKVLLQLGKRRFGRARKEVTALVNGATSPEAIQACTLRVLDAVDWDDLVQGLRG